MRHWSVWRSTAAGALAALAVGATLILGSGVAAAATIWNVASSGTDSATCGTAAAPCKTIGQAVTNAAAGDTVSVAAGTYKESVTLAKNLALIGISATIDATGQNNGLLITTGADGSSVTGFTISGATGEGILATKVSKIAISSNTVTGNDLGAGKLGYADCQPNGSVPGDCGEGVHLNGVSNSTLSKNTVSNNLGGILLTDELGPTSGNTVDGNNVSNNPNDCGITLAGHNLKAFNAGQRAPAVGGVFNNTISNNTANNNGSSGVGIFASAPGTAAYGNTVTGNTTNNNGIPGISMHAHAPNQDLNDNKILNNVVGKNNLVGDPDSGDKVTTGILISSPVVPVTGTTISGNQISNNEVGIWLAARVTTDGIGANTFTAVTTQQQVQAPVGPPAAAPAPPKTGNAGLVGSEGGAWLMLLVLGLTATAVVAARARAAHR